MENIGNVGIGLGANITTERGRKHRKTTENIGNGRIGTGGNITTERGGKRRKTTKTLKMSELELVEIWYMTKCHSEEEPRMVYRLPVSLFFRTGEGLNCAHVYSAILGFLTCCDLDIHLGFLFPLD